MPKSVAARSKAFKRHPQRFLTVVAAGVAAVILAACGASHTTSGNSSHQHTPAPTHTAATTPPAAAPTHTAKPIPQGNGGDHDADNNGGPSDGDGNI
jgi:hypothetical protein